MSLVGSREKLNAGDSAIDFDLLSVDGKRYTLADFSGKEGLLLIFMCNHCPYVIAKAEAMKELHQEFGDRVAIVGINSNDPEYMGEGMENMQKFVAEYDIEFPYLIDDTQEVARAYGATCTPDPFLFDKDGKLVFHGKLNNAMKEGDVATEHTMQQNIRSMLAGEHIDHCFDPSIGCSIKWK